MRDTDERPFDRLVRLVRHIEGKPSRGRGQRLSHDVPDIRLRLDVTPGHATLGLDLKKNKRDGEYSDFIPDVAVQSATDSVGDLHGSLDEMATGIMDDLVTRALRVGRMKNE